MENTTSNRFDPRAFTVLMMVACIAALPVTGYFNHVLGFDGITVSRHAWMSAHNAIGALFVVFATWHTLLNRRALLRHARTAVGALPSVSRGALVGCALVALFLFVAIGHALHVPPRQ
jgi:hypothetical protein